MKFMKWGSFCALFVSINAVAGVDKIYDPYVTEGEIEVESRAVHQFDDDNEHKLKLGVGYGVNSFWFVEGYVIGEKESGEGFNAADVEIENKFQLTEQGRYWIDAGLLMELEKEINEDVWELKVGPLFAKQIKKWVVTTNFFIEKKFGSDDEEHETELQGAMQVKYLLSPSLQPAVEYYGDEKQHALGLALLGKTNWGKTPVKWELGALGGLNNNTPDFNLRWLIEWEFY